MADRFDINEWMQVPERVSELLPRAEQVKTAHMKAAEAAGLLATSAVSWEPESDGVSVWVTTLPSEKTAAAYVDKFSYLTQAICFREIAKHAPDQDKEILVKVGSMLGQIGSALGKATSAAGDAAIHTRFGIAPTWHYGNKMLGGPNPLTNGIVASLMMGGLGYGAGTLAENLFPERYLERGKLRRTLGMLGAMGGVGLGLGNAYANARTMGPGKSIWEGMLISNNATPPYMQEKAGFDFGENPMAPGDTGLFAPKIPVPQFNALVWNDVRKGLDNPYGIHTDPAIGAATTGLMSGISSQARSPIISPMTIINGIASAGVGLATANLAGRALGALAGLTPEAQNKLQDMGLYGGMLHAIVPPLLGIR